MLIFIRIKRIFSFYCLNYQKSAEKTEIFKSVQFSAIYLKQQEGSHPSSHGQLRLKIKLAFSNAKGLDQNFPNILLDKKIINKLKLMLMTHERIRFWDSED